MSSEGKMTERCNLYRVKYYSMLGYVVYRHCFDDKKADVYYAGLEHKTAAFVTEHEAEDYAYYRNRLTDENGSDALPYYPSGVGQRPLEK